MDGVNNLDIRETLRSFHQGLANTLKAPTKTFPTMSGNQYQLAFWR